MKKYLLITGAILVVAIIIGVMQLHSTRQGASQVCTQEAKICPDGSAVGRTGPNCSFAPCPTSTTSPAPATGSATTTLAIGEKMIVNGTIISPDKVLQDSRCPVDVQCIQAGTVTVHLTTGDSGATLTLGQPQTVAGMTIKLVSVTPAKQSKVTIVPSDYRFTFTIAPQ